MRGVWMSSLGALALMLLLAASFVSCGDDDDGAGSLRGGSGGDDDDDDTGGLPDDDASDDDSDDDDTGDDDVDDDDDDTTDPTQAAVESSVFFMGCEPEDSSCADDEKPRHEVFVFEFVIDIHEVTNAGYLAFLAEENPENDCNGFTCVASAHDATEPYQGLYLDGDEWAIDAGYEDRPAGGVSWYGANAYCASQNRRLPTEAEWEKAAKGGFEHTIFPWGDTFESNALNYLASGDPFEAGPAPNTTPVGYFDGEEHDGYPTTDGRSPYGLHDMLGNAAEWVGDYYGAEYYADEPDGGWQNPSGPDAGDEKVIRGSAWSSAGETVTRNTRRDHYDPDSPGVSAFGFRCAHNP
ncbi:MAG: formylglycine-generating enzyme family protein [Deltaproteobacteria bacterium]|nr:formylglycine-generating enzyme family protein [Deltaproteobacteria bacterium]